MATSNWSRRGFLARGAAATAGLAAVGGRAAAARREFKISIAGWSLHREVFGGQIKTIDAFRITREEFNLDGFELVNTMLEVPTWNHIANLKREADKHQVQIPLIMVDGEGNLGGAAVEERERAVRYHQKWIYAAADLGCHSVRVNWRGEERGVERDAEGAERFIARSVAPFAELAELGARHGLNVIIENHGGPSSYPDLLRRLFQMVDRPNFGALPDFGNFPAEVDRYEAVDKMMPYAKALSAKCYDFGDDGLETKIDFERMLQIAVDKHGYHGFIGIEYEGNRLSERDGIRAARDLLIRLRG